MGTFVGPDPVGWSPPAENNAGMEARHGPKMAKETQKA